jgi:transcriptional regulator
MYVPKIYRNDDISEIIAFIRHNGFAQVVSTVNGKPFVTHLPVMYEVRNDEHYLHAHMARANPQWKEFTDPLLIIFTGPHTYISSSWYDHVNVPTWNYIAVHAYGQPRIIVVMIFTSH